MGSRSCSSLFFSDKRLTYTGQDANKIPSVLSKLYGPEVESLDMSYNSLISIEELCNFPNLVELVLDNNQLDDSIQFPFIPSLHTLSLNKNQISNLEFLLTKIVKSFPNLKYLSLLGNLACPNQLSDCNKDEEDYQRYRYYVLHLLPQLKFLDSSPVNADEKYVAITRGKYMRIARPKPQYSTKEDRSPIDIYKYSPLPKDTRLSDEHQGVYGKCRFRYSGKHSEGNRFIRNNDL